MKDLKRKYNIVCISAATWDAPLWTNRQHIMSRLSKKHRILYVNPSIFLRTSIKRNIIQKLKNKKFIGVLDGVNKNLWVFTPPFILPFGYAFSFVQRINISLNSMILGKIMKRLNFDNPIFWFYDPEGVRYLKRFRPRLVCYDCVDEYSTMPFYSSPRRKKRLERLEGQLIKRSDTVFTTSIRLFEEKREFNPNTYLVPNVGDFEHFNQCHNRNLKTPEDIATIAGPILGFVGAVDSYKLDFELIDYISKENPEWSIVIIGPKLDKSGKKIKAPERENIYYLGRKEYVQLPNYIQNFSVCIIPYKITKYTERAFPIKVYEFLATGKPVVTTDLPAIQDLNGIIKIAKSNEEFCILVREVLSDDNEERMKKRIEIAKRNTWETRVEKLMYYVNLYLAQS